MQHLVYGEMPTDAVVPTGSLAGPLGQEASTAGKWLKSLVVLGLLGGVAYWIYQSQYGSSGGSKRRAESRAPHRPLPTRPPRSRRPKKEARPQHWFYAEGDKSTFFFKAPRHMPHPDEDYAEKVAPKGGMIWKVRPASRKLLAELSDLPRVE